MLKEDTLGDDVWLLVDAFDRWRVLGLLPWPGDMGEQPAWFVEALHVIALEHDAMERQRETNQDAQLADLAGLIERTQGRQRWR